MKQENIKIKMCPHLCPAGNCERCQNDVVGSMFFKEENLKCIHGFNKPNCLCWDYVQKPIQVTEGKDKKLSVKEDFWIAWVWVSKKAEWMRYSRFYDSKEEAKTLKAMNGTKLIRVKVIIYK